MTPGTDLTPDELWAIVNELDADHDGHVDILDAFVVYRPNHFASSIVITTIRPKVGRHTEVEAQRPYPVTRNDNFPF